MWHGDYARANIVRELRLDAGGAGDSAKAGGSGTGRVPIGTRRALVSGASGTLDRIEMAFKYEV
ncbi:hypothetical protein DD559_17245 [Sphingomonas pokkalii]|uniref:Uncharacterized protein n=1 Tax=Sphingomonas pokkalii TaxID=2175090 RepID=A0A2U0SHP2_9SPHN|nr:hypothetical protein DD559_17245 [Sphingomonas pokkalii]